jgi:hypothetical protein
MMELRLEREPNDKATPGTLFVDNVRECVTLERPLGDPEHPAILYGRYVVTLRPTYNKKLWTPSDDRLLLHIEEGPGRAGIEIHAGNTVGDTEGCVLVGYQRSHVENEILESRRALVALMEKLTLPCRITIVEAPTSDDVL